ncbi:LOW QUALITY PROTEIN: vasorin [Bufo gargarizans]|uniref:LOW QUALITY PROTEIN: vasorin n=1 Tax=Bufo gargarizans TaxID=30331 RepID=UPI001CF40865|nr:LOW QUALITY PROTEIN: vasorin [Bufo gargarizans]
MHLLLVWIVLSTACTVLTEGCPDGCQCNQPFTVFCLSRKDSSFPRTISPNTINLYLFENGISSVEESSFSGLWDLQLLDLSHNKLSNLPGGVFKRLTNLSNLDLSSNQITEISAETFQGLSRLERLYLSENHIRSIHPDAFRGLENLLELKLTKNQLVVAPAFSLPHLLLLDLSYNAIPAIHPGVFHARNIETLRLAGLGLKEVPADLLSELKNLHELDLSDNQLSKVPSGLRGLTKLNLAGNVAISQLQLDDFSGLSGLQDLDLSRMSLRNLPKGLFQSTPRLRGVSLAQNPFNCVCLLSWLTEWLRVSGVALLRSEETRCHFPPKNAGKILRNLQNSDFGCPIPTTVFVPTTLAITSTAAPLTTTNPRPTYAPTTTTPTTTIAPNNPTEEEPVLPTEYDHQCPPQTCLNGGLCHLDHLGEVECECPPGFYGMYCEMLSLTPADFTEPPEILLQVLERTSNSLKVDLQSYIESKKHLLGLRLTVQNLSGSDDRPDTYPLPPTLPHYTLTGLNANSTYRICLGSMLGGSGETELCSEAQTEGESPTPSAHITQTREGSLTLVLVPAIAAGILLLVVIVSAVCYTRRRREKAHACENGGPLELEGVKPGLDDKSELKKLSENLTSNERGWESEEPLMDSSRVGNNNGTPTGRLPHSYF